MFATHRKVNDASARLPLAGALMPVCSLGKATCKLEPFRATMKTQSQPGKRFGRPVSSKAIGLGRLLLLPSFDCDSCALFQGVSFIFR